MDLTRLASAVHFSVPPTVFVVLLHAATANRVIGITKFFGRALSPTVLTVFRRVYVVVNAVGVASALFIVVFQCVDVVTTPGRPVVQDHACYPTLTLGAVLLLILLWTDRAILHFLHAPRMTNTIHTRLSHGCTIVGLFMALAAPNDAHVLPLLMLGLANRSSASVRWSSAVQKLSFLTRIIVAGAGSVELWTGGESRRSAVLCVLCALDSGRDHRVAVD